MFAKNKIIIFMLLVFLKIVVAEAAMEEAEPSLKDKIRAELQYALMYHNDIMAHPDRPLELRPVNKFNIPEYFVYDMPSYILNKAKNILGQKAQEEGWSNVIKSVDEEFKRKAPSYGIWLPETSGYWFPETDGPEKNDKGAAINIVFFYYALQHLSEALLNKLEEASDFSERTIEQNLIDQVWLKFLPEGRWPSPEYLALRSQIIVKNQDIAKRLITQALTQPTHDILVKAIANNYSAIVKLILKQGIVPSKDDLLLAQRLYEHESKKLLTGKSFEAKESFGRIIKIIYNYLKLLTPYGGISKKSIIEAREEITPEIAHHIAQFLD